LIPSVHDPCAVCHVTEGEEELSWLKDAGLEHLAKPLEGIHFISEAIR